MAQKYFFITIFFYRNIVCQNVSCDVGLEDEILIISKSYRSFIIHFKQLRICNSEQVEENKSVNFFNIVWTIVVPLLRKMSGSVQATNEYFLRVNKTTVNDHYVLVNKTSVFMELIPNKDLGQTSITGSPYTVS